MIRAVAIALMMAMAASALAQTPSARSTVPRHKVIEMDPLEFIGKVQKPHVFYVIRRGELKHEGLPLERSLLKEVEDSVKRPPF